jgi:hypothetical protein
LVFFTTSVGYAMRASARQVPLETEIAWAFPEVFEQREKNRNAIAAQCDIEFNNTDDNSRSDSK